MKKPFGKHQTLDGHTHYLVEIGSFHRDSFVARCPNSISCDNKPLQQLNSRDTRARTLLSFFSVAILCVGIVLEVRHCTRGSRFPVPLGNVFFREKANALVCRSRIGRSTNREPANHLFLVTVAVERLLR